MADITGAGGAPTDHAGPQVLIDVVGFGRPFVHRQIEPDTRLGDLIALDGSDVIYEVVAVDLSGADVRLGVRVLDDRPSAAGPARRETTWPASSDGVDIALHHLGGDGPPLLVAHGTGLHGLAYAPLAAELAGHFDVWAVDLRGHGLASSPASGDFAWAGTADDILAAVEAMGSQRPYLVGNSLGCAAAVLAEAAAPGLFESAYFWEPIVVPAGVDIAARDNRMGDAARKRRNSFESKAAVRERFGSKPPFNTLRPDSLAAYVEHGFRNDGDGDVVLSCHPEHEARTFEAVDKPTTELVEKLDLPIMVATGTLRGPGPALLAPPVAEAATTSACVEHPHLGHLGPLEDPAYVAADVVRWFDHWT